MFQSFKTLFFSFLCVVAISGCARLELASHVGKKVTGSTAKSKGMYKVGSPYRIKGKKYYPAVDYDYNEVGMASWYGPNFHGKSTANGETFNQNDLTAAHRTLPLPSIVRVTNLDNKKSLIVRVNDRGPYAHNRILDLSKRSAELLGFKNKGVTKVRVQVLEKESRQLAEIARNGQSTRGMEVPMNKYRSDLPKVVHRTDMLQSEVSQRGAVLTGERIQLASFSSRPAALRFSSAVQGYGRPQIQQAHINGAQYYRVILEPKAQDTAQSLLARLHDDGYTQAIIASQ